MKHFKKFFFNCCLLTLIIFSSCTKKNISNPSTSLSSSTSDEVSLSNQGFNIKLTLRPGPNSGQDVYVDKELGVRSHNLNYVPELNANAWTIDGNPYNSGSYIRFDSLVIVPTSTSIISAKLYLFGLSSSLSTPQGDNGDNACYIQRVLGSWDESTLKHSTEPASTTEGQSILLPSTSQWNYNAVADVTGLVSYMVAHPSENFGFFIHLQTQTPYRSIVFGSSEQSDKNLRPKLVVTYQ